MLKKVLFSLFSIGCAALSFAAVNVNTATVEELDKQLTGIGPAKARAIVEYREKNGPFKSVDDLAKVPGSKEATVNKFRAQATVGNGNASVPKPTTPAKPQPATK